MYQFAAQQVLKAFNTRKTIRKAQYKKKKKKKQKDQ
jgi:hypothetical protein